MIQGKDVCTPEKQQGNKQKNEKRIHPTQKPVALHALVFERYKIPKNWKIFDPNLGSGSLGIACLQLGYSLDGCESDREYFRLAREWLTNENRYTSEADVSKYNCKILFDIRRLNRLKISKLNI